MLSLMVCGGILPGRGEANPVIPSASAVQMACVTRADADFRLIDITGQIGVSALPGLSVFTLELSHHQSLGGK